MLRHRGDVGGARVVEHRRLPRQRGVLADAAQLALGLCDEILVAELEVAAADVRAELPGGEDLRPPPGRELRGSVRHCPRLLGEALGQREKRERGVAAVANQMNPERVREQTLEQRQVLHVERRLVAPARLSLVLGVHLEDGGDRLAGRHPLAQPGTNVLGRDAPLVELVEAPQVVEEVVEVRPPPVPLRERCDEERLVRDRDLAVPVEHHAQQRPARAADAEHDHGRSHRLN